SWIMLAMAHAQGLHAEAEKHDRHSRTSLRIALDAVVAALSIGERCVEGVRRLATPTAPQLLRAGHTPTASFVRRRLWRLGEAGDGPARASEGMAHARSSRPAGRNRLLRPRRGRAADLARGRAIARLALAAPRSDW